jgi:hypothetical protein
MPLLTSAGTYLHQHLILRLQTYNFARRVASLFSTPERLFFVCFRTGGTCTMSRGVVSAAGAASTLPTDNQIGRMVCEITGRSPARPCQVSSVASLVRDGQDTILVAATGYGKSAVLYTFATMTKKITLQIVPLTKLGLLSSSRTSPILSCVVRWALRSWDRRARSFGAFF